MKRLAPFIVLSLLLTGCAGGEEDPVAAEAGLATEVEATTPTDTPASAEVDEADSAEEAPLAESDAPDQQAPAEPAVEPTPEPSPEPEAEEEPQREEETEEPQEEVNDEPAEAAPVLPVINDIEFFCRSRNLTVNVHAKIPGTKGSEGRYNWGISKITAFRKNEYNAELDHELKWDGQYDPEKDKWISAERTISGDQTKDMIRILVEGRDANGNDVKTEATVDHGTGC